MKRRLHFLAEPCRAGASIVDKDVEMIALPTDDVGETTHLGKRGKICR